MKKIKVGVIGCGSIAEIAHFPWINKYPVFALVSYFENNPKALLEAMACEKIVIGADVEGIKGLIDNDSGILVSNDPESIRNGLEKAFDLSEEKRVSIGKKARNVVKNEFSIESVIKKDLALYEGLLHA